MVTLLRAVAAGWVCCGVRWIPVIAVANVPRLASLTRAASAGRRREQIHPSFNLKPRMVIERNALAGLNLRQLKERALHIGADEKAVEAMAKKVEKVIDEADDPKAAVIELLVTASRDREQKLTGLRRDLEVMTLGDLKQKCIAVGVSEEEVQRVVGDAAEPQGAAIGMIEQQTRKDHWATRAKLMDLILGTLDEKKWTSRRAELRPFKLGQLKEVCAEMGANMERVSQVIDEADNPRVAIVEVIVVAERELANAEDALRAALQRLRVGQLKERAAQDGLDTDDVAEAIDDADDPIAAVVQLIMDSESRLAAAAAISIAAAVDAALGVTSAQAAAASRLAEARAARAQLKRVASVLVTGLQNSSGHAFNAQCNGTYAPPPEVLKLREEMAKKSVDELKKQAENCGPGKGPLDDMFLPFEAANDKDMLMELIEAKEFYSTTGGWPRFVNGEGCHLYYHPPDPNLGNTDTAVAVASGVHVNGAAVALTDARAGTGPSVVGGQWYIDDEFTPETTTRWAAIDAPDGLLPVGEQIWQCGVTNGQPVEQLLTVKLTYATELTQKVARQDR